jgi:hypothetical protein
MEGVFMAMRLRWSDDNATLMEQALRPIRADALSFIDSFRQTAKENQKERHSPYLAFG